MSNLQLGEKQRRALKSLLFKANLYKLAAAFLFLVGIGLTIGMYFQFLHGDLAKIMKKPFILFAVFVPFLPSFFFVFLHNKVKAVADKIVFEHKERQREHKDMVNRIDNRKDTVQQSTLKKP